MDTTEKIDFELLELVAFLIEISKPILPITRFVRNKETNTWKPELKKITIEINNIYKKENLL